MGKIIVGIDQSYDRCGISVLEDKDIISIEYLSGDHKTHSEHRRMLRNKLNMILSSHHVNKIIYERIRLRSDGFISLPYIQATGALCGTIIECGDAFKVPVYSVETSSWKSKIVGTSKPQENPYGIDPKKYPTILYMRDNGLLKYIIEPYEGRAKKGIIMARKGSERFRARIVDDMADSYCIALYGFLPEKEQKLKKEDF